MLRIPGMRYDDVCSIVLLDMNLLSWFNSMLCANQTHTPGLPAQSQGLETRLALYCCCLAAVAALVTARTPRAHICNTQKRTNIEWSAAITKERAHSPAAVVPLLPHVLSLEGDV